MGNSCLIISGGYFQSAAYYKELAKKADYVICADGGARYTAALDIIPDLVVGDFDSLTVQELDQLISNGVKTVRYPTEKDFTDTHIALLEALERGYLEVDIIAALGGRLDHTIANIMLLALPTGQEARIRILDENQELFLVRHRVVLQGRIGETISLFPLSEYVKGINTKGLKYPLQLGTFKLGVPIGISNEFLEDTAEIELEEGLLLVIKNKKQT
ncbi:MAG: thiamine diphosphokinase [Firmicutes bacterium HGW-Firmicutes-12]|jgi:thiamine pyrophosphokinase|nr:MAG: thiamine diphosphokinase [Firmicutes bacterium HGW-Firmicutes-12]